MASVFQAEFCHFLVERSAIEISKRSFVIESLSRDLKRTLVDQLASQPYKSRRIHVQQARRRSTRRCAPDDLAGFDGEMRFLFVDTWIE